jgi:hypothetical protein
VVLRSNNDSCGKTRRIRPGPSRYPPGWTIKMKTMVVQKALFAKVSRPARCTACTHLTNPLMPTIPHLPTHQCSTSSSRTCIRARPSVFRGSSLYIRPRVFQGSSLYIGAYTMVCGAQVWSSASPPFTIAPLLSLRLRSCTPQRDANLATPPAPLATDATNLLGPSSFTSQRLGTLRPLDPLHHNPQPLSHLQLPWPHF